MMMNRQDLLSILQEQPSFSHSFAQKAQHPDERGRQFYVFEALKYKALSDCSFLIK